MKHCIAFFIGLLAFQVNAQITGTVIDTENNLPLEYALLLYITPLVTISSYRSNY